MDDESEASRPNASEQAVTGLEDEKPKKRNRRPSDEVVRRVAHHVRTRREQLGLTQGEVAEKCGLTGQYISNVETWHADNVSLAGWRQLFLLSGTIVSFGSSPSSRVHHHAVRRCRRRFSVSLRKIPSIVAPARGGEAEGRSGAARSSRLSSSRGECLSKGWHQARSFLADAARCSAASARQLGPVNSRTIEWCTTRSIAAAVVIGSLKI